MSSMLDSPCLTCVNLRKRETNNYCNAIRTIIADDIVQGVGVEQLPSCPYYSPSLKEIKIESKDDEEISAIVVFRPVITKPIDIDRMRPRRRYRRAAVIRTATETRAEIIDLVRSFYQRRKQWPSHYQIFIHSRFKSLGQVYNLLNEMIVDGQIYRTSVNKGKTKYIYSLIDLNKKNQR